MAANVTSDLPATTAHEEELGSQVQNPASIQSSPASGNVEETSNPEVSSGDISPEVQAAINAMKGKKGLTPDGTCGSVAGVPAGWKVGSTTVCALISFVNLPCLACSSMSLEQIFKSQVSSNNHDSDF